MELWNSDGSSAELSGNGLRCLGQALVLADVTGAELTVATARGTHALRGDARPTGPASTTWWPTWGRSSSRVGPTTGSCPAWSTPPSPASRTPTWSSSPPSPGPRPDLDEVGQAANDAVDGGINVEIIRVSGNDLILDVFERGAGRTQACGTGACAAAAVAHDWGLVGHRGDRAHARG